MKPSGLLRLLVCCWLGAGAAGVCRAGQDPIERDGRMQDGIGTERNPDDLERLATWMDANALFYGTFDAADQARQQRGERIAGPKLE